MIVLDTHAWIWLVSQPGKLSRAAQAAISYSQRAGICPISCWEIATKVSTGKLLLDREVSIWMRQALARADLEVLNLSPEIAVLAGRLNRDEFHGDPADRLIVATALYHGVELITKDRQIRSFRQVRAVW